MKMSCTAHQSTEPALDTHATIDRLKAMQKQEDSYYLCGDYLSSVPPSSACPELASTTYQLPAAMTISCRTLMTSWSYRLIDQCKLHRSTVAIAMSHLDRFLNTRKDHRFLCSRTNFQLASISCLYVAIKVNETIMVSSELFASVSGGMHTAAQIEETEFEILKALDWHISPPTALAFVYGYLDLMNIPCATYDAVLELAKFQTEVSVQEYKFVNAKRSEIAYCAIMNVLEAIQRDTYNEHNIHHASLDLIVSNLSIERGSMELLELQAQLHHASSSKVGKIPPDSERKSVWQSFTSEKELELSSFSRHITSPLSVIPRYVHHGPSNTELEVP